MENSFRGIDEQFRAVRCAFRLRTLQRRLPTERPRGGSLLFETEIADNGRDAWKPASEWLAFGHDASITVSDQDPD
jgi:hypothetical protein